MEQRHNFSIDGVEYAMTPANARDGWEACKKIIGVLSTSAVAANPANIANLSYVAMQVIGSEQMPALERLVISNTVVRVPGSEPVKLESVSEQHIDAYRGHWPRIFQEGAAYQLGDFFAGMLDAYLKAVGKKKAPGEESQLTG